MLAELLNELCNKSFGLFGQVWADQRTIRDIVSFFRIHLSSDVTISAYSSHMM